MSTMLFLTLRVLHVLLAAVWLGATVFMTFLLMPAMKEAGPAGGQVMMGLNRRGVVPFFASVSGITVLTGIYLFWRFTGGFDPEVSRTNAGLAYSIGGAAGLAAAIIGGSIVGRSAKKLVEVMTRVASLKDGAEKSALIQEADGLRQRMASFGKLVLVLQVAATALMAVAHYI